MSMELFDRQKEAVGQGERTILVHVELTSFAQSNGSVDEFKQDLAIYRISKKNQTKR